MPKQPIERHPKGVTLPRGWHAVHNFGIPYRPRDKPVQEDWGSVARKFGVDVDDLIFFNFMTNNPDEVNWYLHHHTGCNKPSPSGNNWMFSNSANPGVIYIPPPDDTQIDYDPQQICSWLPSDIKDFMLRLDAVSRGMSGYKGQRIKTMVRVIVQTGYPAALDLWYYNDMVISVYVDWKTDPSKRREMTQTTGGAFPFDGESGVYGQQGSEERNRGKWQIHPVKSLFDEFACGSWDATAIKERLENIDDEMYKGWHEMDMVTARATQGGGTTYVKEIYDFIHHVSLLADDDTSLYSAFRS
jgi:hypothetical protein